jgi:hypothetical protein
VPATAYVQDGLVVQYDGLENAGAGVHDAGITAWKDLTGNGHDLALNANDTVGADCVNIAKASRTASNDVFSAYASITIEFNARPTAMDSAGNWDAAIVSIPYIGAFGWDGRKGAISVRRPQSASATAYYYRSYNSGYNMLSDILGAAKYQTYAACPGYGDGANSADDPVYVNGAKVAKTTSLSWSGGTRANSFVLTVGNTRTASDVRSIRIYSRQLSATEIAINAAVDKIRFDGAALSVIPAGYHYQASSGLVVADVPENTLAIGGGPENIGEPTPAYGLVHDLSAGDTVSCSCPSVWTNAAGTMAATCTGWKLYDAEGDVVSAGTGNSFTYTHPTPAAYRRLEWQWAVEYLVTASVAEGTGAVSPASQWVAAGASATVVATDTADGFAFCRWSGGATSSSRTLTVSNVSSPLSLNAHFTSNVRYVGIENAADDDSHGLSPSAPFATVAKALSSLADAGNTGVVCIAAGDYDLTATISLTTAIQIVGAGRDATRLFGGAIPSSSRGATINHAKAVLSGLSLLGCTNTVDGAGIHLTAGTVEDCRVAYCKTRKGSPRGAGIYINGAGTVRRTKVDNNYLDSTTNYSDGGGIYVVNNASAVVEDCEILDNYAPRYQERGLGIYILNGTVRRCLIQGNHGKESSSLYGSGVYIERGTLERCQVVSNGFNGVYIASGTVRNCLVTGHAFPGGSWSGVYLADGTLANCTITGNASTTEATGVSGLQQAGGTAVNNIVWGNGPATSSAGSCYISGGTFNTNLTDKVLSRGAATSSQTRSSRTPSPTTSASGSAPRRLTPRNPLRP